MARFWCHKGSLTSKLLFCDVLLPDIKHTWHIICWVYFIFAGNIKQRFVNTGQDSFWITKMEGITTAFHGKCRVGDSFFSKWSQLANKICMPCLSSCLYVQVWYCFVLVFLTALFYIQFDVLVSVVIFIFLLGLFHTVFNCRLLYDFYYSDMLLLLSTCSLTLLNFSAFLVL